MRRRSIAGPLQKIIEEDQPDEFRDQKDQIARLMDESIKYIDANDLEKSAKSIVKIATYLNLNAPIVSLVEPMSKSECVAFIKWNLQRIDLNSDALDEFGIDLKEELYNRLNVIEQTLEPKGGDEEDPKCWKTLSDAPAISHYHTLSKDKQEIGRRISNRREENFVYEDEALEDVEFETQEGSVHRFKTQTQSMKSNVASISLELSSKPLQKNRGKCASRGKVRSKYLPQACERHRLLHARCPANCPDRIKRDALRPTN